MSVPLALRPVLAGAAVLAMVVVGCSSDDAAEPSPSPAPTTPARADAVGPTTTSGPIVEHREASTTTATTPTSPSEPAPGPGAEQIDALIAARVRAFFDAREAANAGPAPDPGDPSLPEVAAGEALASLIAETQERRDDGRAVRAGELGLAEIRVGSVEVDDDAAGAAVCSIDDGVIYVVETGEVLNDDVVTHSYVVDLELSDAVWRVARVVRLQQWEGVAGCALAAGDFPF